MAGSLSRKPGLDARQIISRKSNLASRVGGPVGMKTAQIPPPLMGDVRSQLGKRKFREQEGARMQSSMQFSVNVGPTEKDLVMQEYMMIRQREQELARVWIFLINKIPRSNPFTKVKCCSSHYLQWGPLPRNVCTGDLDLMSIYRMNPWCLV